MRKPKVKTIDVNAVSWFDKVNGNSYFAGEIVINYGMDSHKTLYMPFQYGYGSQYEYEAKKTLQDAGYLPKDGQWSESLYTLCANQKIILRTSKITNCKKAELTRFDRLIERQKSMEKAKT